MPTTVNVRIFDAEAAPDADGEVLRGPRAEHHLVSDRGDVVTVVRAVENVGSAVLRHAEIGGAGLQDSDRGPAQGRREHAERKNRSDPDGHRRRRHRCSEPPATTLCNTRPKKLMGFESELDVPTRCRVERPGGPGRGDPRATTARRRRPLGTEVPAETAVVLSMAARRALDTRGDRDRGDPRGLPPTTGEHDDSSTARRTQVARLPGDRDREHRAPLAPLLVDRQY